MERKNISSDACLAMEWMCNFRVRLDKTERPSCVEEVLTSAFRSMRAAGKSGLRLSTMATCAALLCSNDTRLSLPNFSKTDKPLMIRAEMPLWSAISQ